MFPLIVALLALQQAPATPAATAPAAPRRAATATVEIRVTDRAGAPVSGGRVVAEGASNRDGITDGTGAATFRTVTTGVYRMRAEAAGYISLEKEVTVRTGTMPAVEFALSSAPAPPKVETPPPPPVVVAPTVEPGEPKVISLLDVAENSLGGKEALRTVAVGCSGLSRAQLLVVRESLPAAMRTDADDMLYVIAGEASITIAGKTQQITSGWFSVVPRGTERAVVRRGRNPVILLSIVSGPPCASGAGQ